MTQPYQVETYDAYDAPDERSHLKVGLYESAEAALAGAKGVVDGFLVSNREKFATARELSDQFDAFGEVPMIFGPTVVEFRPFDYARERAEAMYR